MINRPIWKIWRLPVIPRAVIFVPSAMALWWFLLKGASLWLLRIFAFLPLVLFIAPPDQPAVRKDANTGEWLFNVSVNAPVKNMQTGRTEVVQSVEFAADENNVAFFASGWFSFLALALSVSRSGLKPLLTGLGVQTAVNVLSLLAYVYINARGLQMNDPVHPTAAVWLLKYAYHIIYLVVPFAGPFGVALLVFPQWRELFQPGDGSTSAVIPSSHGRRNSGRMSASKQHLQPKLDIPGTVRQRRHLPKRL